MDTQLLGSDEAEEVKSEAKEGDVISPDGTVNVAEQPGSSPEVIEAEAEESEPKKKSDELKISILLKGTRALLGAKATDCDPKLETLEGDLPAALLRLPAFVDECKQQWAESQRNPKSTIPEPEPPAPPSRVATSRASTPAPKEQAQPKWF